MGLITRLREKLDERFRRKLIEDALSPIQDYPRADSWSDFEMRKGMAGAPRWLRTRVGEIVLDSGRTVVYSTIYSEALLPGRNYIEIEGYKTGFLRKKVRRFNGQERSAVISEVEEKIGRRYDMSKFECVDCM